MNLLLIFFIMSLKVIATGATKAVTISYQMMYFNTAHHLCVCNNVSDFFFLELAAKIATMTSVTENPFDQTLRRKRARYRVPRVGLKGRLSSTVEA